MRWQQITEGDRWDAKTRQWVDEPAAQTQTVVLNGVQRPSHNSENGLIAPTPEAQAAFWKWFGASKVVDEHGRPRVVHRGDRVGKTEFTGRDKAGNYIQGNIFFASERAVAAGYAHNFRRGWQSPDQADASHGLYSAYLRMLKPLVIDGMGENWDRLPLNGRLKKALDADQIQIDDLALYVQRSGRYDGLIAHNVWDQYGDAHQYIVFRNEQIKLVGKD